MQNDKGEIVIPIGAPGSPARVRAEMPALVERLNSLHAQEASIADAVDEIRAAGVRDAMTTRSLLEVSLFRNEAPRV